MCRDDEMFPDHSRLVLAGVLAAWRLTSRAISASQCARASTRVACLGLASRIRGGAGGSGFALEDGGEAGTLGDIAGCR
jgi:hypothetical protein